jgi:hypothetical protein
MDQQGGISKKMLINRTTQVEVARKLLLDEPKFIEESFQRNLLLEEPMNSCFEAMSWLEGVGDRSKGFNRAFQLQRLLPSTDGSMLHGVFEINGNWYKSSFRTGRLFFQFWGTDIGCLANVPEEDVDTLLKRFTATMNTHLKAEFSSVFGNEYHNNAFFSWKNSTFYGCIRNWVINETRTMVDSEFRIKMSKEDFFTFTKPYVIKPD